MFHSILEPPRCSTAILVMIYIILFLQLFPSFADSLQVGALIFVFPISFFYYFLYYTDTMSTLSILVCYWLTVRSLNFQRTVSVSVTDKLIILVSACVAILARQTNAVWVMFIAGTAMVHVMDSSNVYRYK